MSFDEILRYNFAQKPYAGQIKAVIATLSNQKGQELASLPWPNPRSLNLEQLEELRTSEDPWFATEKTDGVAFAFVASRFPSGEKFAALVNRRFHSWQIVVAAPEACFDGTFLLGELVRTAAGHFTFLVFNVVAWGGKTFIAQDFSQRLQIVSDLFMAPDQWNADVVGLDLKLTNLLARKLAVQHNKIVPLVEAGVPHLFMYAKRFVRFEDFAGLHKASRNLPHPSDGYIIQRGVGPIVFGTDHSMLKYKFQPTIDVLIASRNDRIFPVCRDQGKVVSLASALPSYTFTLVDVEEEMISQIVEMAIDVDHKKVDCRVHIVREDKDRANEARTIVDIIREVRDKIPIERIIAVVVEICERRNLPVPAMIPPTTTNKRKRKAKQQP